ncbi:molecular chaperone [Stutzerimonas azotifigens]|uniref:Molecular chaperone n=1 Tax=Stutzerimonas azotifigens TaxID=291995 RepID=A0ABR5YZZ5_9GAMM|nr:molecular chaperone [Stutzerimonas azotifigens]MBA1273523.1 molecular chaperone [Stutzerimonas azotifigens]
MDRQSHHLLLRVSTPTRQALSFCDPTVRDMKRWIAHLPKANIGETARQLYQALLEFNQLLTPSDNRLQLLELLRPEVHFVCKQLEKHFLNQPIVLDERPRKVASLCQALQNHLAGGYKLIVARVASTTQRKERQPLLTIALQRAMHSLRGPLIRANQLYCPVPEGLWLEMHQLYEIACERDVHRSVVRDDLAHHTQGMSVEQSYIVALLLGCARCNQMRQQSIARLSEVLEPWSSLVNLQLASDPRSLFALSPLVDGPPRYRSLFQTNELPSLLGIDPQPLVDAIKQRLDDPEKSTPKLLVPEGISIDLLQHLGAAWGDISERTFQRTPGQGKLTLCIGMSPLHYYLAGERSFNDLLKSPQAPKTATFKLQNGAPDIWANAFDAQSSTWEGVVPYEEIEFTPSSATAEKAQASTGESSFATYPLQIINHSPGGYCLSWPKEVPSQLQAGELLGLQDPGSQGWSVAVVRWIRQVRGGGTQMGIELVAPHAQPCGLQLVRKADQGSHYLRALLLPEISAISRPATLITPRLPFQEGHKVQINQQGEEHRALLSRRQTSTGSYSQFEYRIVGQAEARQENPITAQQNQKPGGEEDFDSLWKSL